MHFLRIRCGKEAAFLFPAVLLRHFLLSGRSAFITCLILPEGRLIHLLRQLSHLFGHCDEPVHAFLIIRQVLRAAVINDLHHQPCGAGIQTRGLPEAAGRLSISPVFPVQTGTFIHVDRFMELILVCLIQCISFHASFPP